MIIPTENNQTTLQVRFTETGYKTHFNGTMHFARGGKFGHGFFSGFLIFAAFPFFQHSHPYTKTY